LTSSLPLTQISSHIHSLSVPPSSLTIMNFIQHNGVIRQPRRRRSSLLDRWIQEQQLTTVPSTDLTPTNNHEFFPSIGTDSNPYLAYPHLSRVSFQPILDDVGTLRDYGSVDDVNLPPVPQVHRSTIEVRLSFIIQFRSFVHIFTFFITVATLIFLPVQVITQAFFAQFASFIPLFLSIRANIYGHHPVYSPSRVALLTQT